MSELTRQGHYDKTEIYEREISPLIEKLFDLCQQHELPAMISIQYSSDENENGVGEVVVNRDRHSKQLLISPAIAAMQSARAVFERAGEGDAMALLALKHDPLLSSAIEHAIQLEEASLLLDKAAGVLTA